MECFQFFLWIRYQRHLIPLEEVKWGGWYMLGELNIKNKQYFIEKMLKLGIFNFSHKINPFLQVFFIIFSYLKT